MKRLSEAERDALALDALARSGSEDFIEYPVALAGFSVALCRLTSEHWRAYIDGTYQGNGRNARAQAIARARLAPTQGEVGAACQQIPKLADHLAGQIERLHHANADFLTVVEVDDALDASAVAALGVDPAALTDARERYPMPGQLRIANYRDDELEAHWHCVLHLPDDLAHDMAKGNMRQRGHEAAVTYLVNALAVPDGKAASAFVAENPAIAACLFPTLVGWGETVAAARPTIWRRKSRTSAMSTGQPTSSLTSSSTSESSAAGPPAPPGSS